MIAAFASFGIIGYYSDWFVSRSAVPRDAWIASGLLFWFYMTADNCDGIQARRLGVSSPVGELLDHGCDAMVLNTSGQMLAFMYLQNDNDEASAREWGLATFAVFQICFFLTHAVSILSGKLMLGFDYLSIDELFLGYGAILIAEGFFPGQVANLVISVGGYNVRFGPLAYGLVLVLPGVLTFIKTSLLAIERLRDGGITPQALVFGLIVPLASVLTVEYLAAPCGMWWFITWIPQYAITALSVVSWRMGEDQPRATWWMCLAVVAAVQFGGRVAPATPLGLPWAPAAASAVMFFLHVSEVLLRMKDEYSIPSLFFVPAENQRKAAAEAQKQK